MIKVGWAWMILTTRQGAWVEGSQSLWIEASVRREPWTTYLYLPNTALNQPLGPNSARLSEVIRISWSIGVLIVQVSCNIVWHVIVAYK